MSKTRVILDNSAFAGVMRLYCPDEKIHAAFLNNYPQHREIDEQSLANFLTAVVLYGKILLDSSSYWNEKRLNGENDTPGAAIDRGRVSWAEQMLAFLPRDIAVLVTASDFSGRLSISEDDSCRTAFDVMCSPLRKNIALQANEKIPKVYKAEDYVYRPIFDELNRKSKLKLNRTDLAQAMFLHRGIFLQSRARQNNCVYLPYYYRGKMLANLPPLICAEAPDAGLCYARLPLAEGTHPDETSDLEKLNAFYYALLKKVTWVKYPNRIPFIGSAVLAKASGDLNAAFTIALELRSKGGLAKTFSTLHERIQALDRPGFNTVLKDFKSQLMKASAHSGLPLKSPLIGVFYKMCTSLIPKRLESVIHAALALLPEKERKWGYQAASTLLTKTPLQLLFLEHVRAIRNT